MEQEIVIFVLAGKLRRSGIEYLHSLAIHIKGSDLFNFYWCFLNCSGKSNLLVEKSKFFPVQRLQTFKDNLISFVSMLSRIVTTAVNFEKNESQISGYQINRCRHNKTNLDVKKSSEFHIDNESHHSFGEFGNIGM